MASIGMCPPSTNWYSPLAIGYSPEIVPWMTARSKNYANPCAGSTLSKVHTFMRQLRVVVLGLREKLDDVNEEIKSLSKMREGMARSLDQLSLELNQDKCEAVIKRPRFIKNRTREAKVDLWERGSDTVRMDRVQMLRAQAKIRKQYTYVKEQLQELSRIRNRILVITRERTRVLDLFPDVIVASTRKKQDKQEQQRTRSHQVMLQYASNKPGLNKSGTRATPNGDAQKFVKTGQNLKAAKSEMDFRKTTINKSTGRSKSAGPEKNTEKRLGTFETDISISMFFLCNRKEAWTDNSATKCLCDIGGGHLPPVMTSECQDAINSVVQVRKSSQALRRQIHQVVEESFLVDQTVSPAKEPEQHGQYYGVACGGRSPHKRAMFIH